MSHVLTGTARRTGQDARPLLVRRPWPSAPEAPPPVARRRVLALRLSAVTLVSMTIAAVLGLAVDGAYGEPESTASMLRGYDLVTLVLAVPLLGWALWRLRTGSLVAELVWVGLLGYAVYGYGLYLAGTGFNDLFLLHTVVLGAAVFALPLALSTLPSDELAARCGHGRWSRGVAAVLALLAVSLGTMWAVAALRFVASGTVPEGSALVETPAVVHAGMALDLVLLVPGYATAAVLLWRRSGWGYAAAALLLVSGTLHQVAYMVALPFQTAAGVPGAVALDPAEPVIAAAFVLATAVLLAAPGAGDRPPAPGSREHGGSARS